MTEFVGADIASIYMEKAEEVAKAYPKVDLQEYKESIQDYLDSRPNATHHEVTNIFILKALERISMTQPDWTYVAAAVHAENLYIQAAKNRGYDHRVRKYGDFYKLLTTLHDKGIYSDIILSAYSEEEIMEASLMIDDSRDSLFTYIGLRTVSDRYLATDHSKNVFELPQERFLVIALVLMSKEKPEQRLSLVKEAYWALSNLYMTVATPTLANAGKSYGQLSSCFIDTVEDSLDGIYNSNTDAARLSKAGGGIGIYVGKIRSRGSDIKGFKGNSSGIVPWIKQINNTASSVDQLGQRQGAIAVYYNVFGRDVKSFLELRLNNGDERQRAHDIFLGLCIPDNFMRAAEAREMYYIFDPHTIKKTMGYELDDFFDAKELMPGETPNPIDHAFTYHYDECVEAAEAGRFGEEGLLWDKTPAIEIFKSIMKSQLETGVPYMFYRDTVNRANPNSHAGMIYCSNLCTEIQQNMSATSITEEYYDKERNRIITVKEPGDFVVCNLSSVNLARAVWDEVLERLIPIQVRMLDNVIDLNTIQVLQAQVTNQKYRAVGLGTFGWQHLLAKKHIDWETPAAVQYADELYEEIAFLTIQASMELSKEKGAYPAFKGSEWESGRYFEKREYVSEQWKALTHEVNEHGLRNGYLLAVAPNSSTAIIAGTTASIDPIFRKVYSEEKKDYKIPVTAPELSAETTWYYKTAYQVSQHTSIAQQSARQRHIDQAVSFNLYVQPDIKAKDLLALHMDAWKSNLKTTYYVRSRSSNEDVPNHIEECESCSS